MTILLIGGTGKTGVPLAHRLVDANYSVLVTSRSGKVPEAFEGLVGPPALSAIPVVKDFIELAITKGVTRFVVLSASATPRGGPGMGQIHQYLAERGGVEYAILRPTWFMENFTYIFYQSIRENDTIASTTKDGRIPFVSVYDIADAAFKALIDDVGRNTEYIILGPESHNYDEAATLLSEVLGRKITHQRLTHEEGKKVWLAFGMEEAHAELMLHMEHLVAVGKEEAHLQSNSPLNFVGNRRLKDYLENNREAWVVKQ
ncbi:hypothetical protein H0H81_000074 [Sphagnurus paluster]|uniref:NAD(P)-binding domain-containing protein n=1 Tax=Sphagnurus paluster TaxID=117069 RepID=A0A9P7GPR3_9AGAR|nr:hypothetical protein H0H81_000074 [Sphagnurus paluster]